MYKATFPKYHGLKKLGSSGLDNKCLCYQISKETENTPDGTAEEAFTGEMRWERALHLSHSPHQD